MRISSKFLIAALAVAVGDGGFANAQGPAQPAATPQGRETEHFVIAGDGNPAVVAQVAALLESTYEAVVEFAREVGIEPHTPPQRLSVSLLADEAAFRAALQQAGVTSQSVVGFYDQRSNRSYFWDLHSLAPATGPTPEPDPSIDEALRLIVAHETAHQVMFNVGILTRGVEYPDWWVEGLACLFEVPRAPPVPRPSINRHRWADLRKADAENRMTLAQVIASWPPPAGDAATTVRYAYAWGLVSYLRDEKPVPFAHFAKAQAAKRSSSAAAPPDSLAEFTASFGPPSDTRFREWLTRQ